MYKYICIYVFKLFIIYFYYLFIIIIINYYLVTHMVI